MHSRSQVTIDSRMHTVVEDVVQRLLQRADSLADDRTRYSLELRLNA